MRTHTARFVVATLALLLATLPVLAGAQEAAKPFTIILMPDTQNYADMRGGDRGLSEHFFNQTQWILDNKDRLSIAMVAHVGDIVQTDYAPEWEIADKAFKTLDGKVPYSLCVGNHDMGYDTKEGKTAATRETLANSYFPPSRFQNESWYGGNYADGIESNYCLFEAGGMKFIIVALEFKPRDEVLAWANEVVSKHADRRCIVTTHYYLREDGKRGTDHGYDVPGNSPEEVWQKFVSKHANIFMVLCGHVIGESHQTSVGENGNKVHEILVDYQGLEKGGNGYLSILAFDPEQNRIEVKGYSPSVDVFTQGESNYSLEYPMTKSAVKAAGE